MNCPGCVGRGTGTKCYVCSGDIAPADRRNANSPTEVRRNCADCQAGRRHTH